MICLIILSGLCFYLLKHDYQQSRKRYNYIAQNEVENIAAMLDCVLAHTDTLKTLVQDHDGETDFFDGVAREIYASVKRETGVSLKNVAIAPMGVVSHVYPLEGNESLIGFNFMDSSKSGNSDAIEAYEKWEMILTPPFELVQGGKGIAGRLPVMIYRDDVPYLWGLVTVTIDYENFMKC